MDFSNYIILIVSLCLFISICMNFVLLGKRITEGYLENEDADDSPEWDVDYPEEEVVVGEAKEGQEDVVSKVRDAT